MTVEDKRWWVCQVCLLAKRKRGDNTNTPLRDTRDSNQDSPITHHCLSSDERELNIPTPSVVNIDYVTKRKQRKLTSPHQLVDESQVTIELILMELREFRTQMAAQLQTQETRLSEFTEAVNDIRTAIGDLKSKYNSLRAEMGCLKKSMQSIADVNESLRSASEYNSNRIQELELIELRLEQSMLATAGQSRPSLQPILPDSDYADVVRRSSQQKETAPGISLTHGEPLSLKTTSPAFNQTEHKKAKDSTLQAKDNPRQRPYRRTVIRATGDEDSELKTVEPMKYIHVWNFHSDTTSDNILGYLKKKRPDESYTVKSPTTMHTGHHCFIIGVPAKQQDFFMSPNNWPRNTALQEWHTFRPKPQTSTTKDNFFRPPQTEKQ